MDAHYEPYLHLQLGECEDVRTWQHSRCSEWVLKQSPLSRPPSPEEVQLQQQQPWRDRHDSSSASNCSVQAPARFKPAPAVPPLQLIGLFPSITVVTTSSDTSSSSRQSMLAKGAAFASENVTPEKKEFLGNINGSSSHRNTRVHLYALLTSQIAAAAQPCVAAEAPILRGSSSSSSSNSSEAVPAPHFGITVAARQQGCYLPVRLVHSRMSELSEATQQVAVLEVELTGAEPSLGLVLFEVRSLVCTLATDCGCLFRGFCWE